MANAQHYAGLGALAGCSAKLIHDGRWIDCQLAELTADGASVETHCALKPGDPIVACISDVGAIPGAVKTIVDGRFAIEFAR